MIYMSSVAGLRRRPTTRTWIAFGTALAAVLVLSILIVAAWQARAERADAGVAGAAPAPTATSGLGAGGTAAGQDAAGHGSDGPGLGNPGQGSGTGSGSGTGIGTGTGSGGGGGVGTPATPAAPSPPPPPAGPTIESFEVTQQPTCPGGTDQFPVPGQPVGLEWVVTGTAEVSLSIDGPGVYDTYPASGGAAINFPCEGKPGGTQQHTYLLTATANGVTVTDLLVVTATVNEITSVSYSRVDS